MSGGAAAAGTVIAGSAAILRGPADGARAAGYVRPEDFGARGDGVADDGPAFRAACRQCTATGRSLRLSFRRYRGARIEVHGTFDVIGEGATVDYLGIGNTLIEGTGRGGAAVPTPWPAVDRDADADRYPVRGGLLARPAPEGSGVLILRRAVPLRTGDWVFLAQRPTSMSSGHQPGNYIPSDFAFVRVRSVEGAKVVLDEPLRQGFDAGAGAFASSGMAIACRISDLTIGTDADAYHHVLRSGRDITLEGVAFIGESAVGACTFADAVTYRNCRATNAYGPLSIARGCSRILIDGYTHSARRTRPTAEPFAVFLEESFHDVEIRRVVGDGAGFSIRSADMTLARSRSRIRLSGCRFRTDTATQGATGAFQGGVAIGVEMTVEDCIFQGAAIRPHAGMFPGISERALTWMASMGDRDSLVFSGCTFQSIDGGTAFAAGSGLQGRLSLDPRANRFIGCRPPARI